MFGVKPDNNKANHNWWSLKPERKQQQVGLRHFSDVRQISQFTLHYKNAYILYSQH